MNGEKIQSRHYIASSLLMAAGIALFYIGLAAGKPIAAAGVATLLAGFSIAVYALLCVLFRAKNQDRRHAIAASVALVLGWLG